MPTIHTLGTKAIMAARYKAGKENRRRYDQEFAEDVKNKKAERAILAFNANAKNRLAYNDPKAYQALIESERRAKEKEYQTKYY